MKQNKQKKNQDGEQKFDVGEIGTGWYKVKATSNSGAVKYEWVKVANISEKLTPPEISITSEKPIGGEGWYISPAQVTITTDSPSAKEIRYRLVEEGITKADDQKYTEPLTISTLGKTSIYAWTVEETEKYQSEESLKEVKIDTEAPTIDYIQEPIAPETGWYTTNMSIAIAGEDKHSRIKGYTYSQDGGITWKEKRIDEKIEIIEEGTTEILAKTIDKAGNVDRKSVV